MPVPGKENPVPGKETPVPVGPALPLGKEEPVGAATLEPGAEGTEKPVGVCVGYGKPGNENVGKPLGDW